MGFKEDLKAQSEAEKRKERFLDEIHSRKEVKNLWIACEVIDFIEWVSSMFLVIAMLILFGNGRPSEQMYDIEDYIMYLLIENNLMIFVGIFIFIKFLFGIVEKKMKTKLQILEDSGLKELEEKYAAEGELPTEEGTAQKRSSFNKTRKKIQAVVGILLLVALFVKLLLMF